MLSGRLIFLLYLEPLSQYLPSQFFHSPQCPLGEILVATPRYTESRTVKHFENLFPKIPNKGVYCFTLLGCGTDNVVFSEDFTNCKQIINLSLTQ